MKVDPVVFPSFPYCVHRHASPSLYNFSLLSSNYVLSILAGLLGAFFRLLHPSGCLGVCLDSSQKGTVSVCILSGEGWTLASVWRLLGFWNKCSKTVHSWDFPGSEWRWGCKLELGGEDLAEIRDEV